MSGPPEETPAGGIPFLSQIAEPGAGPGPAALPEIPPADRKRFPGIGGAILLVLLITALQCAGGIAMAVVTEVARAMGQPLEQSDALGIGIAVVQVIAILPAIWLGWLLARRPVGEVLPMRTFHPAILAPLLVVAVGLTIVVSECDNLTRLVLPMPEELARLFQELFEPGVGMFVALVLVAPVMEELLFRGVILTGFLTRYRPGTAIFASAVLFAIAHLNPYQFAAGLVAGLFLGWLMIRTRSLWPCILMHALFNAHVAVMPILRDRLGVEIRGFTGPPQAGLVEFQPLWFNALGLILVGAGVLGVAALGGRPRAAAEAGS